MNRYLLLIYVVGMPVVALTILYVSGSAHLWAGFPFVWVNCLLILSLPNYGQCGYYFDRFALLLDVLFYAGWGYALLGCYELLRGVNRRPFPFSNESSGAP
jgi:hypothetical protein